MLTIMRSSRSSPGALTFEHKDLDAKGAYAPSSYAPRCSITNRPMSSPAGRQRITFSTEPVQAGIRSAKARKARTPGPHDASPSAPASQSETSARSQFDLMVSSRLAHHDAVQASLQTIEVKSTVRARQVNNKFCPACDGLLERCCAECIG